MTGTQSSVAGSFAWKLFERFSVQGINLVVQIVLARIIAPEAFGALAILMIFVNVANIFVQKGFGSSLIRMKAVDDMDCDSAFWACEVIAALLFLILVFCSPYIASFFGAPELMSGLVVISTSLFLSGLFCIQNALLVRDMMFRAIFLRGLFSSVISGVVGIAMAVAGFGLWALVAQTLLNQAVLVLAMLPQVAWKPSFSFSLKRVRGLFDFGGSILVSELLSYAVEAARGLFIGREYATAQLSYYDRGQTYPSTLMRGIYDAVGGVLLPVFSRLQDEPHKLACECARYLSLVVYAVTPVFIIFAASSEAVLVLLLTEKWLPAATFCTLFCFAQLFQPAQGVFRQAIYATGKSSVILKLEIVKDVVSIAFLIAFIPFGPIGVAVSFVISMAFSSILMGCAAGRLLPITSGMVIGATWKTAFASLLTFVVVWAFNGLIEDYSIRLIVQVVVGIGLYLVASKMVGSREQRFLLSYVSRKLPRRR